MRAVGITRAEAGLRADDIELRSAFARAAGEGKGEDGKGEDGDLPISRTIQRARSLAR